MAGTYFKTKSRQGIAVGNGFGKLMGFTQVEELGEIETPILLTNTLAVPAAAEALIEWTLESRQRGSAECESHCRGDERRLVERHPCEGGDEDVSVGGVDCG
jgi:L-aminopeptidase/D-esterase-like protein